MARRQKKPADVEPPMVQGWVHKQIVEQNAWLHSERLRLRTERRWLHKAILDAIRQLERIPLGITAIAILRAGMDEAARKPAESEAIPDDGYRGRMGGNPE